METRTLEQRGLPVDSYFEVVLKDGSIISEKNHNWHDISEEQVLLHGATKKIANVCTIPIKKITIHHVGLEASIEPEKGEQVYQAIKSSATLQSDSSVINEIVGRVVGCIKNGVVTQEKIIDARTQEVVGIKF
jgi:hypothetical protein